MPPRFDPLVYGYWPARQLNGEIPDAIQHPDDYDGEATLNVSCTQTALTRAAQARLVAQWCERLPELPVRTLVLSSKVPQTLFDAACAMPRLEALSIKWGSYESLAPLAAANGLRALWLGAAPALQDLSPLGRLTGLQQLYIEAPGPVDLGFLQSLRQLKEFGLSAGRGRRSSTRSLEPLASLDALEMLWLVSIDVEEGGLVPLHGLPALASLRSTSPASSASMVDLRAAVKTLKHFQAVG